MCAENISSFSCGGDFLCGRECQAFTYSIASAGKSGRIQNTICRSGEEILPGR